MAGGGKPGSGRGGARCAWEFEPCWAFNEPEQVIELAHELAGPGFGVLYDTAHAHTVSETGARQVGGDGPLAGGQIELLRRLSGTIAHVHLLDSDGTLHESEDSTERTTVHIPFGTGGGRLRGGRRGARRRRGDDRVVDGGPLFWPDAWSATEASKEFVDALIERAVRV